MGDVIPATHQPAWMRNKEANDTRRRANEMLALGAVDAAAALLDSLKSDDEAIRQRAALAVLDRALGKAPQQIVLTDDDGSGEDPMTQQANRRELIQRLVEALESKAQAKAAGQTIDQSGRVVD